MCGTSGNKESTVSHGLSKARVSAQKLVSLVPRLPCSSGAARRPTLPQGAGRVGCNTHQEEYLKRVETGTLLCLEMASLQSPQKFTCQAQRHV
jgi:hypothetical protein